ncbi:MAG: integrase, partial [Nitrosopumilales archaeon CG_4_9_14_0_8_um_filter_34_10]
LPEVGKRTGGKPYTTEHIALMLEFERVMRNKAIIHFLAATGVRVGAIQDIKLKHVIDFKEDCKMVTVYADTKDEYVTFLTPEASMILDIYLEKRKNDREYLNPESPLFRTTYQFGTAKAVAMKKTSVCGVINRGLERTGLRVTNTSKRYDIQIDHGFRKRWNTIVKNTDGMKIILAEKMMGHAITIPLDDTYNVPVFEKLFQEYKKAISELTIDESERLRIKNEQQQKKITELEVKNARIEKLERRMRVIEKSKER